MLLEANLDIHLLVSIPIGFSSTLQQLENITGQVSGYRFQSLSGFRVRCNCSPEHFSTMGPKVSIPIGFSSTLQRLAEKEAALQARVSIPIGFSSTLQHLGA